MQGESRTRPACQPEPTTQQLHPVETKQSPGPSIVGNQERRPECYAAKALLKTKYLNRSTMSRLVMGAILTEPTRCAFRDPGEASGVSVVSGADNSKAINNSSFAVQATRH